MDLKEQQSTMVKLKTTRVQGFKLKLLEEQGWVCALCGLNMRMNTSNACLDHDHTTGFIRGVLCRNCNRGEGKVRTHSTMCKRGGTSVAWLMSLCAYLLQHTVPQTGYIHPTHKTVEDRRISINKRSRARRADAKSNSNN